MVVVGAYLRVYNYLFLPFLPKMGIATKSDKAHLIIHFLTIGVYTFSNITMSPCPPRWYQLAHGLNTIAPFPRLLKETIEYI
jgi:hypothetical protein